ncbi:MAG: heavy-metal-associated domain-containing protein, partial [Clostridia bacterium]|nr:heavy-metal-associated domain-containing protein [Clostridia bacterium]
MRIYKLQSLHCRDCGVRLEQKLRKLPHGEEVKVDYEKKEITVPDDMKDDDVRLIFAQEKVIAYPKDKDNQETPEEHDHRKGQG